jgi:hypothetical protein
VYKAFREKETFGMKDVLELIEKNPGLEKMNSDIVSNRGYYKSLFEDAQAAAAPRRQIEKSKAWLERAEKVIPGSSQTFSKGANQHVAGWRRYFWRRAKVAGFGMSMGMNISTTSRDCCRTFWATRTKRSMRRWRSNWRKGTVFLCRTRWKWNWRSA